MAKRVRVLTHGYCFDGLTSAVLFTALRRTELAGARFRYRSLGYGPKLKSIPASWLDGDENALLDFRHTPSPKLDWYFDHHLTAFPSDADRARAYDAAAPGRRVFYDPAYSSCAKLIADVAAGELGVDLARFGELVSWADRVDSARFDSAEEAFAAAAPALVLADVVERHGSTAYLEQTVPLLLERSLEEVAASPDTLALHGPIVAAKAAFLSAVRARGVVVGDVVSFDLVEGAPAPAGKFAAYLAFPRATYSVALMRTHDQLKLGVGYNPWCGAPRRHDLSVICRREGGGGHAVVGAVNFAVADLDRARDVTARVVRELSGP